MTFELATYAVPVLVAVLAVVALGLVLAGIGVADLVRERRTSAVVASRAPRRPQAGRRLALHH